jgi:hypothetical protein
MNFDWTILRTDHNKTDQTKKSVTESWGLSCHGTGLQDHSFPYVSHKLLVWQLIDAIKIKEGYSTSVKLSLHFVKYVHGENKMAAVQCRVAWIIDGTIRFIYVPFVIETNMLKMNKLEGLLVCFPILLVMRSQECLRSTLLLESFSSPYSFFVSPVKYFPSYGTFEPLRISQGL